MTCLPRATHCSTKYRKCGFNSGAPPVISTVWASVWSNACKQASMVSRSITSRRSGPASTWQWRHVILQSLPTLIWKISNLPGRRACHPAFSKWAEKSPACGVVDKSNACNRVLCWSAAAKGDRRRNSEVVGFGPASVLSKFKDWLEFISNAWFSSNIYY